MDHFYMYLSVHLCVISNAYWILWYTAMYLFYTWTQFCMHNSIFKTFLFWLSFTVFYTHSQLQLANHLIKTIIITWNGAFSVVTFIFWKKHPIISPKTKAVFFIHEAIFRGVLSSSSCTKIFLSIPFSPFSSSTTSPSLIVHQAKAASSLTKTKRSAEKKENV